MQASTVYEIRFSASRVVRAILNFTAKAFIHCWSSVLASATGEVGGCFDAARCATLLLR